MSFKLQTHATSNFKDALRRMRELKEDVEERYEPLTLRRAQQLFTEREILYTMTQNEDGEFKFSGFQLRVCDASKGLLLYRILDRGDAPEGKFIKSYEYVDCSYAEVLATPWYRLKREDEETMEEPEEKARTLTVSRYDGDVIFEVRLGSIIFISGDAMSDSDFEVRDQWVEVTGVHDEYVNARVEYKRKFNDFKTERFHSRIKPDYILTTREGNVKK